MSHFPPPLRLRSATMDFAKRTFVMGVVNVTPDSFSDGGQFADVESAARHARELVQQGADILDIGGESTRPGAEPVDAATEMQRVVPVIEAVRELGVPISVDTYKADVAEAAVEAGAEIINDISAGRMDPRILEVAAASESALVLSHIRGTPRDMQKDPRYDDVVVEVKSELAEAAARAQEQGVARERIVVDPGIGFGKRIEHNLELLHGISEIVALGYAVLVGTSRKSFIGAVLGGREPLERVHGTAATVALAVAGGAHIVRVHDVEVMVDVVRMTQAIMHPKKGAA